MEVREEKPSLPQGSRYLPVQKFFLKRLVSGQEQGMETREYARHVVRMIQRKRKPRWFWSGGGVTLVWLLYYFVPKRLRLTIMARMNGLSHL